MRIPIAVAADPTTQPQKTLRTLAEQAFPARVQRRHDGQKDVSQIGQRRINFVGNIQPFVPERPRLPQEGNLSGNGVFNHFAGGGLFGAQVPLRHQCRDAVAMIKHAFAHHLGGVRRQHRRNEGVVEQRCRIGKLHPLSPQEIHGRRQRTVLLRRRALPVLGEIRQHGKKHEAAHESQGLVER